MGSDANVLFALTLSPNAAINHKENEGEGGLHLCSAPHSMQHNPLGLCDLARTKYNNQALIQQNNGTHATRRKKDAVLRFFLHEIK
ncbi:hypothetical protein [Pantoea wallisii]|uniref:hypothetical protein n=1 Tax=Pantoea wallisii TaxID=1076551 RepID=UPI000FFBD9A2|nr:hypothetical protein [Pantoea wallisii]